MFDSPLVKARELKSRRRFDEARAVLQQALQSHPQDPKLRASLADLFFREGQHHKALTLAGEILRDDPNDPRALVVMGNSLLARKKAAEALEYFRLALDVAPTDYLWARTARCHLALRQPQAALEAVSAGEALAPANPKLLRLRAECARMLNDAAAEKQVFERASRAAPADPEAYFTFLYPLLADLPPRRAAITAARLRERAGQERNPHLILFEAESLLGSRDPAGAIERLTKLLASEPGEDVRLAAERLLARARERMPT
ncbi:MAG: tetratricopeptide repeat protein [Deltaproteobacteria bacterium]|nr:tetratricopeptide repeat protein [Deltaproteobacteria bacterium]